MKLLISGRNTLDFLEFLCYNPPRRVLNSAKLQMQIGQEFKRFVMTNTAYSDVLVLSVILRFFWRKCRLAFAIFCRTM